MSSRPRHRRIQYEDTYYDETIIEGDVSDIAIPDAPALAADTAKVIANNVATDGATDTLAQIGLAGSGKIKHVIYIVKENRTYDQVLGDEPERQTATPALAVFGKTVTPNLHALVEKFCSAGQLLRLRRSQRRRLELVHGSDGE